MFHWPGRGIGIRIAGAPDQGPPAGKAVGAIAVLAADHRGLALDPLVAEGAGVARGDALARDRRRPALVLTAPASGTVTRIARDGRHRVSAIEIAVAEAPPRRFAVPDMDDTAALRDLMQASGLWAGLVGRPFGTVPDPAAAPAAIVLSVRDTRPLAPDPEPFLGADFARGLAALARLTEGPLLLCARPGFAAPAGTPRLRLLPAGPLHPGGLPGTHLAQVLHPTPARPVWQAEWPEVVALGHLLATGTLPATRPVALAGPGVLRPRLLALPPGAALSDATGGELAPGAWTVLSGPPIGGRPGGWLRRRDRQVSVLPRPMPQPAAARRAPPPPLIPTRALDRAFGPPLPAVPLLRALSVGDVETAARLGCAALLEEDMDTATWATGGAVDFGALLRGVLDELERSA